MISGTVEIRSVYPGRSEGQAPRRLYLNLEVQFQQVHRLSLHQYLETLMAKMEVGSVDRVGKLRQ
jgi:hypothetical protein